MKTAVIYYSRTGHSKRIAQAIGESLGVEPMNIKQKPKLSDVDLLFVVGGIYGGKSSPDLQSYMINVKNDQVNKAALVTSCMSKNTKQNEIRIVMKLNGIDVAEEEFICQGNFLFFGKGHPSDEDVNNAVAFANRMLAKQSMS
ncbi:hypothetical protein J0B03_00460 [Alkalibacter rhizosphaerae]|uniref:Flavodoxin-like domain-containing protein n=1 Tax=Alkalibacter rhizosphaerae TaxID=2815577 RepID=A0A975AHM4_9FIRM|nr:flavodoxin domain-containing protein [Alkalibacter rhizosphaerae]QSX08602.1 hypothetical protein J0B03_00460 [Alkalibacter rhizosphaerae]